MDITTSADKMATMEVREHFARVAGFKEDQIHDPEYSQRIKDATHAMIYQEEDISFPGKTYTPEALDIYVREFSAYEEMFLAFKDLGNRVRESKRRK